MKQLFCTLCLVVCCGAPTALAVDWWPTVDGAEFRYENDEGETLIVTIEDRDDGSYARIFEKGEYVIHQIFTIDEDGDVLLSLWERYDENGVFVESSTTGLSIIPSPIQPGYQINSPFYQFDQDGGVYLFEVIGSISDEMISVTTPAGTFETYRLWTFVHSGISYIGGSLYLDKQLGPVRIEYGGWELVSWSGIVANEETSWSDLKAEYR